MQLSDECDDAFTLFCRNLEFGSLLKIFGSIVTNDDLLLQSFFVGILRVFGPELLDLGLFLLTLYLLVFDVHIRQS